MLTEKMVPSISAIYSGYVKTENELNKEERYGEDVRHLFHASQSGMCMRKHWFSTNNAPITNPTEIQPERLMRLGTVMHKDYASAFAFFNERKRKAPKEKESVLYNNNYIELLRTIKSIRTECEVLLPELNVRGFYDVLFEMESGEIYLFDFKTIGSYPYRRKFGRDKDTNPAIHHELQLATYGLAVQKEYGRLDGMFLYYYNKDNSGCKQVTVPMDMLEVSLDYWRNVNEFSMGSIPPEIKSNYSPRYAWECNYCQYSTYCQEVDVMGFLEE